MPTSQSHPPAQHIRLTRASLARMLLAIAAQALAIPAHAQSTYTPPSLTPPVLQRTEQGIGDVETLRITLRDMQVDLRQPTGFDGVFRLDRTTAFGQHERLFMRMDGGITAVFPQSVYTPTREGLVPTVPPGTIFYLGAPPGLQDTQAAQRRSANFMNLSVDHYSPPSPNRLGLTHQPSPPVIPMREELHHDRSVWTDDTYRSHRIAVLLRRSAEQAAAPDPPPDALENK